MTREKKMSRRREIKFVTKTAEYGTKEGVSSVLEF